MLALYFGSGKEADVSGTPCECEDSSKRGMVKANGAGLLRDASGHLVESRMGSLSRDLRGSRRKLIDEGLQSLLADLLKDLTVRSQDPWKHLLTMANESRADDADFPHAWPAPLVIERPTI